MNKYETVAIVSAGLTEDQAKEVIKKIESFLQGQGVSALSLEWWGRKDLAYALKKERAGYFALLHFESDRSDVIDNLNNILRITETVLKFQTHRLADRFRKFKGRRVTVSEEDDTALDLGVY